MIFFRQLKGFPSSRIDGEVKRMLDAVGLYSKRNTFSRALSGGMKRKLSVAIALVGDSKVHGCLVMFDGISLDLSCILI